MTANQDVLTRIRTQTRELHRRLERRAPLLDPALDLPTYRSWLQLMGAFHARIEQALAAARFEQVTGWVHRSRSVLAARDLECLGLSAGNPPGPEADDFADLELPATVPGLAGALYVVEGSALGGRVILKQIGRILGLSAQHGASLFAPHGDQPEPRWADCLELLHTVGQDEAMADQVVAGAVQTFELLDQAAARWQARRS